MCAQRRSGESRQRRSRQEIWLEISQNQTEGIWSTGEERPLVDLPDPHDQQLLSPGRLRTEALNMIPEITMARAEAECLAA